MAKKYILRAKEIYARRGAAWEYHYRNRETARVLCSIGWKDGEQITQTLNHHLPIPELQIDGTLLNIPLVVRREHEDRLLDLLRLSIYQRDLLCVWYWTESGWLEFVRQYQALPDVYEDYCYEYDPLPNDRFLLVPVSKPVDKSLKPVDNLLESVDKSGDKTGGKQPRKGEVLVNTQSYPQLAGVPPFWQDFPQSSPAVPPVQI